MRFHVLATDYDGTIAHHGVVDESTREALAGARAAGRKLVLVTGRELADLERVFPHLALFDAIVAENGALVYLPATKQLRTLAEPPPEAFAATLRQREVTPLSVGKVIVATWQPHEAVVLDTIRELGLELQVIFNKGAVMVLPSGVNKAVGLRAALDELGFSPHNAIGVGDAENDHAFLAVCECSVAVHNALPSLKERANVVTAGDHGHGVRELIDRLNANDFEEVAERLDRHGLVLGTVGETPVKIPSYGPPLLITGSSGGGKSKLAGALLEQLADQEYQLCIIDPEGDYRDRAGVTELGDADHAPSLNELVELLAVPRQNAAVNLLGVPLADRPAAFEAMAMRLHEMRVKQGRPHWLVVDEAHHVMPDERPAQNLPLEKHGLLLITVHPEHVAPKVLADVKVVVVVGATPRETLAAFAAAVGEAPPPVAPDALTAGDAYVWFRGTGQPPVRVRAAAPRAERRRHLRKYAAGELGPDKSFYFRGAAGKLNLRVQNLQVFVQTAEGVDDDTWTHHLRQGDYSRWFREAIKDEGLAKEAAGIEADDALTPAGSRTRIRAAIESRYTAAA